MWSDLARSMVGSAVGIDKTYQWTNYQAEIWSAYLWDSQAYRHETLDW